MVTATFTDTVATNITDHFYFKNIRTYIIGKTTPGDHRDEPRELLAKFIYDNWSCDIPLTQIGYDEFFTGYGDIIIKYKEEDSTIVGGMTGHTDFIDASQFMIPTPYHTKISIYVIVRAQTPEAMPAEMNTIKTYIKNFIRARPLGLQDEGYQSIELTDGYFNAPEQRDKNTYKEFVTVMMKEMKIFR